MDDTSVSTDAAVVTENSAVTSGPNPVFSEAIFGESSLYSSGQLLYSVQLNEDTGLDLGSEFAKIFGLRFARGFGKQAVSTLLNSAPVGVTALDDVLSENDIYSTYSALDVAYQTRASWLMSPSVYISVCKLRTVYLEKFMLNHLLGTQAFWRLDCLLAVAGASDKPIVLLSMSS